MLASLGCHYHDSPADTKAVLTIGREQHNSCGCMVVEYVKQGMSLCLAAAAHHLAVDSSKAPGGSSPPQWKRTQQSCRCWRSLWCGSCGLGAVTDSGARQQQGRSRLLLHTRKTQTPLTAAATPGWATGMVCYPHCGWEPVWLLPGHMHHMHTSTVPYASVCDWRVVQMVVHGAAGSRQSSCRKWTPAASSSSTIR